METNPKKLVKLRMTDFILMQRIITSKQSPLQHIEIEKRIATSQQTPELHAEMGEMHTIKSTLKLKPTQ